MGLTDRFAFIGTAHVLAGTFSSTGSTLVPLGEQAEVSIPISGGSKAMVRTGSGHASAAGGIDYGRVAGLNLNLDLVSKQTLDQLLSAATTDASGNLSMATSAGALVPISAVVIPSSNINRATGAVVDPTNVIWLPFLTDDGELTATYNNSRGATANSPLSVQLTGLVESKYGNTVLPEGARNFYWGSPTAMGLDWRLPVPYQAAA